MEIAERFALTESTVKKHVGSVLAKTGARDRVQAVIIAYDAGLVTPTNRWAGGRRVGYASAP
jgi:DNA-binding NarL/FixJ family response regulator